MSNTYHLKYANVTIVLSTVEQSRELLKVIESMMMDYINYRVKEEKKSKND
ncbi:hypothetical protein [Priestia megaterium]|uniref:hypothetical protein n=1 Tax=Priestia megaterium TaxID=1404 RepID=UPI00366A79B0